jgi:hypothetical protein
LPAKVLFFFETDCPTCRLAAPYVNSLHRALESQGGALGVSQDPEQPTHEFAAQTGAKFPISLDQHFALSREFDPPFVPAFYLLDEQGKPVRSFYGFDKSELNALAKTCGAGPVADDFDGNPPVKPGCVSRHREPAGAGPGPALHHAASRASRITLDHHEQAWDYCRRHFFDPLPVVPPTLERVEEMLEACSLDAECLVALIPPNYGAATVEKIAANAVMAGCEPRMMRVLVPLIRAACDERFNLHGVQATTHFAAPLVILNGPVRTEFGFACGSNVFSNVARANSTLGRALQLILTNLGGARPGEIDMSTLGNPGKFSYVIAENEEQSPWEPLVDHSALTLFAGDGLAGISEHNARDARTLLRAFTPVLANVWSRRVCGWPEAILVLSPEHARTLANDGYSKSATIHYLFENTGIPVSEYDGARGEGTALASTYDECHIGGVRCYRKFKTPGQIRIVVAGGTAGKFSAVIGSWATGARGSQSVTYPI